MTGGPGSGDAHYLITMSEVVTAVYCAAVQDAGATTGTTTSCDRPPTPCGPEYQTGEEI